MTCVNPKFLPIQQMYVPCGRCILCAQARTRAWTERLKQEYETQKVAVFITLTYDPEHLPVNGSLSKRDVQLFFKRLRKDIEGLLPSEIDEGFKLHQGRIKYYVCGEYGGQGDRAHYHGIIYGMRNCLLTQKMIDEAWGLGFVSVSKFTEDRAYYTSGYVQKKQYGEKGKQMYTDTGRIPPFTLMSKSIGADWIRMHEESLKKNLTYRSKGKVKYLSRYMRKILNIDQETFYNAIKHFFEGEIEYAKACGIVVDWFEEQKIEKNIKNMRIFSNKLLTLGYCCGKIVVSNQFLDWKRKTAELAAYTTYERIRKWRQNLKTAA